MNVSAPSPTQHGIRLLALSFTALFLELMVIRWVPSELRLVAYYANLMLVSSFLGLGVGALVSARGWNIFRFFPLLFAAEIFTLLLLNSDLLPRGAGEFRFAMGGNTLLGYLSLVLIFSLNAAMFTPLGEAIGQQFEQLPSLRAYQWDLAGSLSGTVVFGVFSFLSFSPLIGLSAVALLMLFLAAPRHRWWGALICITAVASLWIGGRRDVFWSPYYYITLGETQLQIEISPQGEKYGRVSERPASVPPANLATMINPPVYYLHVNQDFYQMHGTIDLQRYTPDDWHHQLIAFAADQYSLPYHLLEKPSRVLVLGAGGGMDVETALLHGVQHIDAVEIDPLIPSISNRYSSSAPYRNPRVTLHTDDGRAFLQRTNGEYDIVAYGFLDSQALFSYGASLRLDGYIHTVESFRKAYAHVRSGGVMVVWFFAGREWLAQKLIKMTEAAIGHAPLIYRNGGSVAIVSPKSSLPHPPPKEISGWSLTESSLSKVDLATDDWPYLYLEKRGIPSDYVVVIGTLLILSIAAVAALRGSSWSAADGHFLFMGWGFLLLQTKSIGDCSLYFGTTWMVTTLVITGVLLMVLLANWVALRRLAAFQFRLYVPLFAILILLLIVPRESILALNFGGRIAWTLLVVPLPVFFAGLIFSTTFRNTANAPALFGANLIGATIGGFCEYLGMLIGNHQLGYMVLAAYAASLLCLLRQNRGGIGGLTPA